MAELAIGGRRVGADAPTFVIVEVGLAHEGSLGTAHAFIDAAADAGGDAVKFQTHIASAEATSREEFRVQFSSQDSTRAAYWDRTSFAPHEWRELADHAHTAGLAFLSSPFSIEAVEVLTDLVDAWKIASGEILDMPMLQRLAGDPRPLLLSTGMSTLAEIQRAADFVSESGSPLALFQCTSRYPTTPADLGLNLLAELRSRFGVPVGFSDHSGRMGPIVAAVALGADLIEVHVIFSRRMFGPDVAASLTVDDLQTAIADIRFVREATQHPVDKDSVAAELQPMRRLFTKSLVAARKLAQGARLASGDIVAKKPGDGLPATELQRVIGRVLLRDVDADESIRETDLSNRGDG